MRRAGAACAILMLAELGAGCGLGDGGPRAGAASTTALATGGVALEARLLVVTPAAGAPALAALQQELDVVGVPYTVVDTSSTTLSADALSDSGVHGLYNGIVLAACGAGAGPDVTSSTAVSSYAAQFAVRTACLGAPADGAHGFSTGTSMDTRAAPLTLNYTPAGVAVFGRYAATSSLAVSGATVALAPPADSSTTPLLVDDAGNAPVAIHRSADGREMLLLTFDQAPDALHTQQLLYGVLAWVTRGVFIGEKRAYLGPQVDDLFMGTTLIDGTIFRMSGADLQNAAAWQQRVQATPLGAGFRLTFPFNGIEVQDSDDLTQAARAVGGQFFFVSHTFDHRRLDVELPSRIAWELTNNDAVMQKYGFGPYDRTNLVTPDISGLTNAPVMQAAVAWGIARVVCDTSQYLCKPAIPNTGVANPSVPALFMIPRAPTGIAANVSTPAQWVAAWSAARGVLVGLSIDQLVDQESSALLASVLRGNIDPLMFHQANLRAYDGTHALLTDVIDLFLQKYAALRVLPIVSLPMEEIGRRMQDRAALQHAGVAATIGPASITVRATADVRVPITGAADANAERYGGALISRVDVPAGAPVTIPLAPDPSAGDSNGGNPVASTASGPVNASSAAHATHHSDGCELAPAPSAGARGLGALALATALVAAATRRRRRRLGARR